jgi:two-component system chemotaxis response regulator CheY
MGTITAGSSMTCLIVDDSAFARFHLKRLIGSLEGIDAAEASNGNEALSEYERLRPGIVLMDIVMPGIEGVETVRRICEVDPGARIIMISSVSHSGKVSEAMAAGARHFLPKPITSEALRRAIDAVMYP